jgi:hypothetical protein
MAASAIDLIGPKGYTHGWVYHGPRSGSRAHTGKLVGNIVKGARAQPGNISMQANMATRSLRGRKASDYQHLAAARLHAAAARQTGMSMSSATRAHHLRMAAMHRGIAGRNVGRQTRGEGPVRQPSRPKSGAPGKLPPGFIRTTGPGKAQGPNIGQLGKAASGSHTLPKGSQALTREGRAKAYAAGHALPPPSPGSPAGFPVTSARSWEKARDAVGRAGSPARREALRQLLRRTAAQYGKTAALKKSWAAANQRAGIELARAAYSRQPGEDVQCPSCGKYNMDDARYCDQCGTRLPESAFEHANPPAGALEMAMPAKLAISSPFDLIITRGDDGTAVVRHRRGGGEIARIRRGEDGWVAAIDGKDGQPHPRQRGALLEAIGTHNRAAGSPYHRPQPAATAPLQPKPEQTPLMKAFGVPAVAAQLANTTQVAGAGDGPRVTGLGPAGHRIYAKLLKRKFPPERARAFASRAERRLGGSK